MRKTYGMEEAFKSFGPYQGASIFPKIIDRHTVEVTMPLVPLNTNYVGTHFGGSLYAMCDPWFMLILMRLLGRDYIVWDKSAGIRFLRPGRGTVTATFHIPPESVDEIRANADLGKKVEPVFKIEVLDYQGEAVAIVEKRLYVRKK